MGDESPIMGPSVKHALWVPEWFLMFFKQTAFWEGFSKFPNSLTTVRIVVLDWMVGFQLFE